MYLLTKNAADLAAVFKAACPTHWLASNIGDLHNAFAAGRETPESEDGKGLLRMGGYGTVARAMFAIARTLDLALAD